jgi:hypothetical protein
MSEFERLVNKLRQFYEEDKNVMYVMNRSVAVVEGMKAYLKVSPEGVLIPERVLMIKIFPDPDSGWTDFDEVIIETYRHGLKKIYVNGASIYRDGDLNTVSHIIPVINSIIDKLERDKDPVKRYMRLRLLDALEALLDVEKMINREKPRLLRLKLLLKQIASEIKVRILMIRLRYHIRN